MGKLSGKVVLLTGASSGLGKQAAIRMAEEGASLAICARRADRLAATKELCEKAGAKVLAVTCDLTIDDNLVDLVKQTVDTFGRIDVLVNNAMSADLYTPFLEQSLSFVEQILNSSFFPTWRLMQLCHPHLKASGNGSIINLGSGSADTGLAGAAAYASIKGALAVLSKVVANEWGKDNIRVNVLCPAALTDSLEEQAKDYLPTVKQQLANNPLGRVGDPYNDIAPAYVFLASDDSSYMTGQTLHLEGGQIM